MATDLPDAEVPRPNALQRLLASPRHRLIAAAGATTLLVAGYLARPEKPVAARVEEAPLPLLQEVVEQRAPQTIFPALQRVGTDSLVFVARIEALPKPLEFWSDVAADAGERLPDERYGVVAGPEEILAEGTGLAVGDGVIVTVGDGRQLKGTVTAHFRERALALVAVEASSPLAVPEAAAAAVPGDAVVAVGPGEEGGVVAPLFIAGVTRSGMLAATPLEGFRGMGVFNETGALVGIIARAGEEIRILSINEALAPLPFLEPRPPALGVSLRRVPASMDPGERVVAIAEVAPGGTAARLGLQPGDVLLDDDQRPVGAVETAMSMLSESDVPNGQVRVLRAGRTVTLRRAPAPSDSGR